MVLRKAPFAHEDSAVITYWHIIIHSKYFPDSDWLKAHAQFTITSYWSPNLEEFAFNEPMTSKCSVLAGLIIRHRYREDLGTRLSRFRCENKNGGTFSGPFYSFHDDLLSKNIARRQLDGWNLVFADLKSPLSSIFIFAHLKVYENGFNSAWPQVVL